MSDLSSLIHFKDNGLVHISVYRDYFKGSLTTPLHNRDLASGESVIVEHCNIDLSPESVTLKGEKRNYDFLFRGEGGPFLFGSDEANDLLKKYYGDKNLAIYESGLWRKKKYVSAMGLLERHGRTPFCVNIPRSRSVIFVDTGINAMIFLGVQAWKSV